MRIRSFSPVAPLALLLAAGCTVGPDYAGPPVAAPKAAAGAAFVRAGPLAGAPVPSVAQWWTALGDPVLDTLEARALAANPDLAAAGARVRQAGALLREQRANDKPKASASALYAHARIPGLDLENGGDNGNGGGNGGGSGNGGTTDLDLFNLGFTASWEIDLFGGTRRAVEAARATAAVRQAQLADAQVSLTAQVADAYVNVRDRQQRVALAEAIVALRSQALGVARQRFAAGTASQIDVDRISQQRDEGTANVRPLRAELATYLNALAVLTGDEPGAHDALMGHGGPLPLPPASVAVGDPAALLRRRPDIRAAERALAADTARIGQSVAARFPRLSFMGIIGIGGSRPTDLTKLDDFVALAAPQLSWNVLDFGRSAARVTQAEAVRDESEAKYRGVVLAALRDAEDSLARFNSARTILAPLERSLVSAGNNARLTHQRYDAGTTTLADVLESDRLRLSAQQARIQAQSQLTLSFIAIQKALGLGWTATDEAGHIAVQPTADQPKIR